MMLEKMCPHCTLEYDNDESQGQPKHAPDCPQSELNMKKPPTDKEIEEIKQWYFNLDDYLQMTIKEEALRNVGFLLAKVDSLKEKNTKQAEMIDNAIEQISELQFNSDSVVRLKEENVKLKADIESLEGTINQTERYRP